jgi:hypothetical protein
MKKEELLQELCQCGEEILSIYNKIQEAINLSRDGKWYHSDTKLQGTKQKISNLYENLGSLRKEIQNEDNKD